MCGTNEFRTTVSPRTLKAVDLMLGSTAFFVSVNPPDALAEQPQQNTTHP
jgi:hypothetical protein